MRGTNDRQEIKGVLHPHWLTGPESGLDRQADRRASRIRSCRQRRLFSGGISNLNRGSSCMRLLSGILCWTDRYLPSARCTLQMSRTRELEITVEFWGCFIESTVENE